MKKKNIWVKILAILALLWIIISIIGTAVLVLSSTPDSSETQLTPQQLQDIISTENIQINSQPVEEVQEFSDTPNQ